MFIARALAGEPSILFLDEPTTGVDSATQEEFYQLLRKLNKQLGITLILVSHDVDVVTKEVTEVACINRHLAYHGTPAGFVKNEHLRSVYGKGVQFIVHSHSV